MVIRSSFVTNSSSSSFVCVDIKSKEIVDILREFENEFDALVELGQIMINSDTEAEIYIDEYYADAPNKPEDIVHVIAALFDYSYYEEYGYAEDDEDYDLNMEEFSPITQRLVESKDEIMKNLEYFKLMIGNSGWQGDDDSRFNENWYTEEALAEVKAAIAAEKDCEIDEITDEDFADYVCDKISIEEDVYEYTAETKELKNYRTTELDG